MTYCPPAQIYKFTIESQRIKMRTSHTKCHGLVEQTNRQNNSDSNEGVWVVEPGTGEHHQQQPPPLTPPYFDPLGRSLPISCSSYCNISVHCLHKAVVLTQHICNCVKYIIKNVITSPPPSVATSFKTISIISPPSCHKLEIITCESSSELICYKIVSHEDL